jgi:hypothetical protein
MEISEKVFDDVLNLVKQEFPITIEKVVNILGSSQNIKKYVYAAVRKLTQRGCINFDHEMKLVPNSM